MENNAKNGETRIGIYGLGDSNNRGEFFLQKKRQKAQEMDINKQYH